MIHAAAQGAALPVLLVLGYLLVALWRRAAIGWFLLGGAAVCSSLWVVFMVGMLFTPWDPPAGTDAPWWDGFVYFSWANSLTGVACLSVLLGLTLLARLAGHVLAGPRPSQPL